MTNTDPGIIGHVGIAASSSYILDMLTVRFGLEKDLTLQFCGDTNQRTFDKVQFLTIPLFFNWNREIKFRVPILCNHLFPIRFKWQMEIFRKSTP